MVGSGVAGLGAAYLLSRAHDVELFEKETRAGGHVHTVEHQGIGLDTGFIVHNTSNYPYLGRLFSELGVAVQESEMSFSVACGDCGLEWSGRLQRAAARGSRLTLSHVEELGLHYAETLRRWRANFEARSADIARLGFDETFRRMWSFYLAYSESGFRTGCLDVSQICLAKPVRGALA